MNVKITIPSFLLYHDLLIFTDTENIRTLFSYNGWILLNSLILEPLNTTINIKYVHQNIVDSYLSNKWTSNVNGDLID